MAEPQVTASTTEVADSIRKWLFDEALMYGETDAPITEHDRGRWYGNREMANRVLKMLGEKPWDET